jgi:hypothetical protein
MLSNLVTFYGQANSNIKLGTIKAIEWPCETGGDPYANIKIGDLGGLFANSSQVLPAGLDLKAMNIFLVSTIKDDSSNADSNLTILGVDGAIGGPAKNGTVISGLAVSTFDSLDSFSSNCSSSASVCPLSQQDSSFYEFTGTVAHEMGHYYRLNHLSEGTGTIHDYIPDTPICTATQSISGSNYITINSCLTSDSNVFAGTGTTCSANCGSYSSINGVFCPNAIACEFNYIMWWTTKNFRNGSSDGSLFSPYEGIVMNYHPLVQ